MKNLILFAKHGANILFRIVMLCSIVLCATVSPVALAVAAVVAVVLYVATHSFKGVRTPGVMALSGQADLFKIESLQKRDILAKAIKAHYGDKRKLPSINDDLRIVRHDLYHTQYLTIGTQTFKFFGQQGQNNSYENNFDYATLPPDKLFVFFGIVAELATGASAADTSDILLFTQPSLVADAPVLNSQITFKINQKEVITKSLYKNLFINDDAIKGYHRFETPYVWEPGGQILLTQDLVKAYGAGVYRYGRFSLMGIELTA